MPNDRIAAALTVIEHIAGEDDRRSVEANLRAKNPNQIDGHLSIGGFRGWNKSEPETFRRSLVRAVVLVKLARNAVLAAAAAQNINTLMNKSTAALQRELLSLFPFKPYRGDFENRKHWAPNNFTDPTKHTPDKYMYLVHGLAQHPHTLAAYNFGNTTELENFNKLRQKYLPHAKVIKSKTGEELEVSFIAQNLDDPHIIRQNIISSTVISHTKVATYWHAGFIMRVPPECIYITSPCDLGLKNRTDDIMAELQDKHAATDRTILTPKDLLAQTTKTCGNEGYNEVVVVGTAPEGKQVEVIGLFVKTDLNGNLYVPKNKNAPWLTPESVKLFYACASKFNLPIVPIPDAKSVVLLTPTPWPFRPVTQIDNS
jgi:hypothetical protein